MRVARSEFVKKKKTLQEKEEAEGVWWGGGWGGGCWGGGHRTGERVSEFSFNAT